ncbi:MAG: PAS domain S-box protein [Thermodesulfovibrionales bacterium]
MMTESEPAVIVENIRAFNRDKGIKIGVVGGNGLPAFDTDITVPKEIFDAQKDHYITSDSEFIFFKPLANETRCHGCHSAEDKTRGMIVIKTTIIEAQKEIEKTAQRLMVFAILLGLASEIFLIIVLRKIVLGPLKKLSHGSTLLKNGMLEHRIELNRKDEIGALATSFNQMAESIERSHIHLEETVNQKTTELRVIAQLAGRVFKGDTTLNSILDHCVEIITEKMGFEYSVLCFIEKESGLLTNEIKRGDTMGFCKLGISLESDHPFAISIREAAPSIKDSADLQISGEFNNIAIVPIISHQRKRCREINICTLEACPAFNSPEERCWMIEDTLCRSPQAVAGKGKIFGCIHCTAFPVLGVLVAGRRGEITSSTLNSLEILASQIASAVENQRLIETKKEDISKLIRLNDISVESLQVLGDTIPGTIVSSATALSNTDASVLWLEGDDGRLKKAGFFNLEDQNIPESLSIEDSFVGTALKEDRCIETTNMKNAGCFKKLIDQYGFLYASSIPLKIRDSAFGCITLFKKKDFFMTDSEKAIILLFASQASAAINTATLYKTLFASEEKYRTIMNDAADAIILIDIKGKILDANKKAEEFTGYSKSELLLKHFSAFLPREELPKAEEAFTRTLAEGTGMVNNMSVLRKDSSLIYVDITGSMVALGGQKILQVILRDVTERRQTEEVLYTLVEKISGKTGDEFFRTMVQYLSKILKMKYSFIGEFSQDAGSVRTVAVFGDGGVIDNFEYPLAGTPCENVVGNKAYTYANDVQLLFPEDLQLVEMGIESYIGFPLFDAAKRPLGLIVAMDTRPLVNEKFAEFALQIFSFRAAAELERLRFEKTLTSANEFSDAIFNSTASGVMVLDIKEHVLKINLVASEILRISQSEIIGEKITDIYPEIKDMLLFESELGREVTITLPDGSSLPVGFTNSPLYHSSEAREGTVILFRDLTEVRKLQAELKKKEHFETVSMIISGVAHEVRNPLFGITSIGQILEKEIELPQHKALTQAMLKEAGRMKRLIDELLLYTKPTNPVIKEVDADSFFEEMQNHVRAKRANISIILNIAPFMTLKVDREKIRQVLLHLLNNAIDAAKSSITISARPIDGHAEIIITDDGAGIREEHLSKIFNPFFTTKKGGTGLGLPICRKIIEDHEGSINIASSGGKGTTITLLLKA